MDTAPVPFVQIGVSIEPIESLAQQVSFDKKRLEYLLISAWLQTPATVHAAPTLTDLALFTQVRDG